MAQRIKAATFETETVALVDLRPHPQNYRAHPEDQIAHLAESLRVHGQYRNIVVGQDLTILAGHGVVLACQSLGWETVVVRRLPLDPLSSPALKILAGDNEIGHLAEIDDRALSELLKSIKDQDVSGLLGTGYDDAMLANLVMVTRPASEIADFDAAGEWVGLPDMGDADEKPTGGKVVVNFRSQSDRAEFARVLGVSLTPQSDTMWWPPRERNDLASVRFEVAG